MNILLSLIKRELQTFFNSLMAYIVLILFLGFAGFFTWMYGADIFLTNQASLSQFFGIGQWVIFFFVPAITMKMVAEEKRTGTIELLLSMPITDRQVILGKFLAAMGLVLVALLLTIPYVITVASIGNLDQGGTFAGYLGLVLIAAMYASIGIYTSTLTSNQVVAFLLTLTICIFFQLLFGLIAQGAGTGFFRSLFYFLDANAHILNLKRGVIDSRDLLYFLSITFTAIFLSEQSLYKRKLN